MDLSSFIFPEKDIHFPAPDTAGKDGILAIGGNLELSTLVKAYRHGTFPWYAENEPILWHHPDPRFVLFPDKIHVSRSMKKMLDRETFTFRLNTRFEEVVRNCRHIHRAKQEGTGTWITDEIEAAYMRLFNAGYALCAEAWQENELAGGLYGVLMDRVFFGESMFSKKDNASKFALIRLTQFLRQRGVALIDCQVYTPHLASLGGEFISRKAFTELLKRLIL